MIAEWQNGPPPWFKAANRTLTFLVSLVLTVVMMSQWALWMAVLAVFLNWIGVVIGGLVMVVQILMIFDENPNRSFWPQRNK